MNANRIRRVLVIAVTVWISVVAQAQIRESDTRDYRAALNIVGRITEISVAPDEQIWLTTYMGGIYYTNSIDSNWHYGRLDPSAEDGEEDYLGLNKPNLNRISFFNADTAIMTGFMHFSDDWKSPYDGYYRTTDGGRTWALRSFGGDGWIYEACVNSRGDAWIGTDGKTIHYSDDFGEHFKALKIPFKKSDRIYGLYMADAFRGIVGSDANEILITEDNWHTARNIPTPLDQKKVEASEREDQPRVDKVLIWGPYLIAKQCGKFFYMLTTNKIDWQPFPVRIKDLSLDRSCNLLSVVDDSLRVLWFASPTEYGSPLNERLPAYPIDIKAVNGSLYMILANKMVGRANHEGLTCHIPYTTDHPIKEPWFKESGEHLIWGEEDGQLYIADKMDSCWYREAVLDFPTCGIKLLSDSVAILWDGLRNHLYSLQNHTVKDYSYREPLHDFLAAPIKKFTISSGSRGCFHYNGHQIEFNAEGNSLFNAAVMSKVGGYQDRTDSLVDITVNGAQLVRLLEHINANPDETLEIQDFKVTEVDKKHYMERLQKRLDMGWYDFNKIQNKDKGLYDSVPVMLDGIDKATLYDILNMGEGFTSTTSNWFEVEFVNQNNDTCRIRSSYYEDGDPWFLPWRFEYNDQHFNCYSIALSHFINNCLTADFYGRSAFDNAVLLMKIGDYFCQKRNY